MTRTTKLALVVVLIAVVAALGWYYWRSQPQPVPVNPPAPPPAAQPVTQAPEPAASEAQHYPIEAVAASEPQAAGPLTANDIQPALTDLLGRKAVLTQLQTDDFPHRVAATVDNLARQQATPRLWPVNPAPGKFLVREDNGVVTIDPDNSRRYTPLVLMAENMDLGRAVALYRRMYPMLQAAYEELGYPGKQFNDRVVQVIDHLLATPEPTEPLQVKLPVFQAGTQPERPWVLYQFVNPQYESLSAGQKILLRVGPVNERRLKARLAQLRKLLAPQG